MDKKLSQKILLATIRGYQYTLSPDHGIFSQITPYGCKFTPTCSQYMYGAVEKFGSGKGIALGLKRLARCHPFSQGGEDPVPHHILPQ